MTLETWHELSVREREHPVGGAVADRVREGPPPFVQGRSRLVILVHGYNNDLQDARRSYSEFEDNLRRLYNEGGSRVSDLLGKFHWPGDANLGPVSFISYPFEITDARESAERLADFLRDLHGPGGGLVQLDFVAHSLGCRMLLETLELIPDIGVVKVFFGAICLMAAAVQVNMVEPGGPLGETLWIPLRLLILHSTGDRVLHYAFPLGQTLAGEGFFPTALGRFRPPPWVPGMHVAVDGLGHGDYWRSRLSAYHVARLLALGVVPELIPPRLLPLHQPPSAHSPPEHRLPEHRLPRSPLTI